MKMLGIRSLLFVLAIVVGSCAYGNHKSFYIRKFLVSLTQDEYKGFAILFEELFINNELAYSLFGNKPMSFVFIFPPPPPSPYFYMHPYPFFDGKQPLQKGIATWKKFQKQFKTPNFSLIFGKDYALLINRNAFQYTVEKYAKEFSPQVHNHLIKKMESGHFVPWDEFNHKCMGILLGYGSHNSTLFEKRMDISNILLPAELGQAISPMKPHLLLSIDHLHAKLDTIDKQLTIFDKSIMNLSGIVCPVNFAADFSHPETYKLKTSYHLTRKKILSAYKDDNWLLRTLEKLTS